MPATGIEDGELLERYLREIATTEPLSNEQELYLAQQARKGNQEARNRFVSANLRFVVRVAREYQGYGVPLSELIAAGNMGLMTAAERFDETRGFRFISYAVWWIRQAIRQTMALDSRLIRLPLNRIDLIYNIRRVSRELRQTNEIEPDPETIARALNVSVDTVTDTIRYALDPRSLDAALVEGEEGSLLSLLPDTSQKPPDAEVTEKSTRDRIEQMLSTLDDREAEILRLYFGLGDFDAMTLKEIGARMHLTRERVRQIKEAALEKLRAAEPVRTFSGPMVDAV